MLRRKETGTRERVLNMHLWLDSWIFWLLAAAVICVAAALIALFVWLHLTATRRHTLTSLRSIADCLLRNVMLPDGIGGYIGVDALLLRDGRLYVLAIRNVEGAIFGGEKLDRWTVIGRHRRFSFRNPLHLIQEQTLAARALAPELTLVPRVVFVGHSHFPKGRPGAVELLEEFVTPLRRPKKSKPAVLDPQTEQIWRRVCVAAGVPPGKEVPEFSARAPDAAGT